MKQSELSPETTILKNISQALNQLLALELYKSGVPQQTIAKQLGMSKTTINLMLKGVTKEVAKNDKTRP